jgi:predicted lysophospholipase L1 biosynthesis ABC-type transport system permease subunit
MRAARPSGEVARGEYRRIHQIEHGSRLALGAQHGELRRKLVRHGLVLAGVGIVIGLLAAAGLTQLLSSLLFGISPLDPVTYTGVPILLVMAAVLASDVAVHRATGRRSC